MPWFKGCREILSPRHRFLEPESPSKPFRLSLLAALVTLIIGRRGRRFARLGAALFFAGLPLLVASVVFWLILAEVTQRAGDPMLHEFMAMARTLAWLPARDAAVTTVAGALLLLPARFRAGQDATRRSR